MSAINNGVNRELPLVSILTPTLNAERHLQECIDSVSSQDYPHIEHIFADAGSSDHTREIIASSQQVATHAIILTPSLNDKGVGSGLNSALRRSKGELIMWLDADDRLEPSAVRQAVDFFLTNPHSSFIFGQCQIMDASSNVIGSFVIRDFDRWEWVNRWHYMVFCAAMFRRDVLESCGFVNDLGNDLKWYLRVAKRFRMERTEILFTTWRLHEGGISLDVSGRAAKIRRQRAFEDLTTVLSNGGSLFSPRALTYLAVVQPYLAMRLRPILGGSYPFFRRVDYALKRSIAVSDANKEEGFIRPLISELRKSIRRS